MSFSMNKTTDELSQELLGLHESSLKAILGDLSEIHKIVTGDQEHIIFYVEEHEFFCEVQNGILTNVNGFCEIRSSHRFVPEKLIPVSILCLHTKMVYSGYIDDFSKNSLAIILDSNTVELVSGSTVQICACFTTRRNFKQMVSFVGNILRLKVSDKGIIAIIPVITSPKTTSIVILQEIVSKMLTESVMKDAIINQDTKMLYIEQDILYSDACVLCQDPRCNSFLTNTETDQN